MESTLTAGTISLFAANSAETAGGMSTCPYSDGRVPGDLSVQDLGSVKCQRQRSKPTHLAESPKIRMEFFDSIVDRNLAVCQQRLERELAHLSETARLRERQPLLLKQRQGKLLLQFGLTDVGRREHFIWN